MAKLVLIVAVLLLGTVYGRPKLPRSEYDIDECKWFGSEYTID